MVKKYLTQKEKEKWYPKKIYRPRLNAYLVAQEKERLANERRIIKNKEEENGPDKEIL
jgi:hypothetical protein